MTINERQDELIEEFTMFDDWMEKYEYIIDLGKDVEGIAEADKSEDYLVRGCQSRVWLIPSKEKETLHFQADSDAIITKGIVGMVVRVLSNSTADEILKSDLYFVDKIGLKEHLSPTRSNGLVSMIKKIKTYALAYSAKAI
ncbi:SufE family protein [Salibacteraceae bacterium]|jgi:cysteine desulfuration protein SufE|nr:Fe-S metabolism protein SufE [Crocinitomicaceae bacterium]MDA9967776.1 SufE family protein [Salibacteraceae bacterium]|tara:strand:+ start:230 stop:652 length:423 start_codon:yes stop_codon:yes gene_type:complete